MKLDLGKPDGKNEGFIVMNARSILLILPAIIIGHHLDEFVSRMNIGIRTSVVLQTFLNIFIIFGIHKINQAYAMEFQTSLAGLFFSAMFFGLQTNYINNLKKILEKKI